MVETSDVNTFVATVADSSKKVTIDSSHPFFLHPLDYPGMNLVSSVFDGKSYGVWRRTVVIALYTKNKLDFIDGTISIPDESSGLQSAWSRGNDMVLSWLLNSLSKEIAESVLYSHNEKDLWNDLEDRFGQTNGKNLKTHQDQRLLQFLMGLNDTYIGVRSNILLSSPLPTIGQAYSLVIQDEKQREIHANPAHPVDSSSFIAANYAGNDKKMNNNRGQKTDFDAKKAGLRCAYYKKVGHNIEKCYRLYGFLQILSSQSRGDIKKEFRLTVLLTQLEKVSREVPSLKSPTEIGKEEGGLYILRSRPS
uniref:Retrotransposon Copia-like N-terminal domain-containing protein n=1 Tax=Nicotiana tabacum TaxID=4097 RepID=A0A1S4CFZ9_TOBAC